jgi:hypothetical protein
MTQDQIDNEVLTTLAKLDTTVEATRRELSARLDRHNAKLEGIDICLRGNGRKGLCARMDGVEEDLREQKASQAKWGGRLWQVILPSVLVITTALMHWLANVLSCFSGGTG